MRKLCVVLFIFLLFQGCNMEDVENVALIEGKGLPKFGSSFQYLIFTSEQEGYLFGTTVVDSGRYKTEANVFKTSNGGESWEKISALHDAQFLEPAAFTNGAVFIQSTSSNSTLEKCRILKFDLTQHKVVASIETGRPGGVWVNGAEIVFSMVDNQERRAVVKTDLDLKPMDTVYTTSIGDQYAVFFNKAMFNITRIDDGNNTLNEVIANNSKVIRLSLFPDCLVKTDEKNIIVAGVSDEKSAKLVRYNIETNKETELKSFEGYDIVKDLRSNGSVIVLLLGAMKSVYNEYNVAYSLDNGETWSVQELSEKSYVIPNSLHGKVFYMMAGGGRLQKIQF